MPDVILSVIPALDMKYVLWKKPNPLNNVSRVGLGYQDQDVTIENWWLSRHPIIKYPGKQWRHLASMKPIMYTVEAKNEPLIVWQMREKDTESFMVILCPSLIWFHCIIIWCKSPLIYTSQLT